MDIEEARQRFSPSVSEIIDGCMIEESFVDKDMFRVYIMTIWGNAVLEPERTGITVDDLSVLHDYLNEEIVQILGAGTDLIGCYEFIMSKPGEESLERLQISAEHRAFLRHFAGLILSQA